MLFPLITAIACCCIQAAAATLPAEHKSCCASPSDTASVSKDPEKTSTPADSVASLYVCPMHPEIRRAEPGKCPMCGMNLVMTTDAPVDTTAKAPIVDSASKVDSLKSAPSQQHSH